MIGLIIKDMLYIKSIWKNLLVMFAASFLISFGIGNYMPSICILPLMLLTSGITTFQMDEFYNSESFTLSLPMSRLKVVTSKYLFTLIMMIISTYIGLVIYAIIHFTIHPGYNGLNIDMIKELIMLESAGLLVDSIFYPVIYKFGCDKSRFVLMSIVLLLLGVGSILSVYIHIFDNTFIDFKNIIQFIEQHGVYILSGLVVICTCISYLLSNLFFRHKDY